MRSVGTFYGMQVCGVGAFSDLFHCSRIIKDDISRQTTLSSHCNLRDLFKLEHDEKQSEHIWTRWNPG